MAHVTMSLVTMTTTHVTVILLTLLGHMTAERLTYRLHDKSYILIRNNEVDISEYHVRN